MKQIGILAYGSIISDPGEEILSVTSTKVFHITTDFKVEFARKSTSRGNAPTLAVVVNGGSSVNGCLFILNHGVDASLAKDMLFRRELNKVGSGLRYEKKDWIEIKESNISHGCEKVLYAAMTPNIEKPEPAKLAQLSIESASIPENHLTRRRDGIRYLYDIKKLGINTPLMNDYESEILKKLNVKSLEEALEITMYK